MAGRLDLTDEAVMCRSLEAERGGDHPFGVYLLDPGDERSELGRVLERDVLLEFFDNTEDVLDREYRPYDDASRFIVLVDHEQSTVAGAVRIIEGGTPCGLKSIRDACRPDSWGLSPADFRSQDPLLDDRSSVTWDIATLGVRAAYRGEPHNSFYSASMLHATYWWSLLTGVEAWVAVIDEAVLALLHSVSVPLERVCGKPPLEYLGSSRSVLCYLRIDTFRRLLREKSESPVEALVLNGAGFRDVVSFPEIVLTAVEDGTRTAAEASDAV